MRFFLLLICCLPLTAQARSRHSNLILAKDSIERALAANDEHASDCQMALEKRLEKVKKRIFSAERGSDRAIQRALNEARPVLETAEQDCPGEITHAALGSLRRAARALEKAVNNDETDDPGGEP